MLTQELKETFARAFKRWSGVAPDQIVPLPASGSDRSYFRISSENAKCIGAHHTNPPEFKSFIYLTQHFRKLGLAVPEIYYSNPDEEIYLIRDFGPTSLFDLISKEKDLKNLSSLLKEVLDQLIRFQTEGAKGLDFSQCYPRNSFDAQSIQWDLNYFKYNYLKLAEVDFHEDPLEKDFQKLINRLISAEQKYFMYRDFQSRNIMVMDEKPWFIDYQGGRKGPLQYDVASLLFQVRADLPFNLRQNLLDYYIGETEKNLGLDGQVFINHYYDFVLLRLLQVLGAYGYRGLFQQKPHFLQSLKLVDKNVQWLRENTSVLDDLPEINASLSQSSKRVAKVKSLNPKPSEHLRVTVTSFSYKKKMPQDYSGNGGGFAFDCRALPNPGREEKYRAFTGRDQIIVDYLEQFDEVDEFFNHVNEIVMQSVNNYKKRSFSHLMVNFGCTGGQHRSVYFAERMARELRNMDGLTVDLSHTMLE